MPSTFKLRPFAIPCLVLWLLACLLLAHLWHYHMRWARDIDSLFDSDYLAPLREARSQINAFALALDGTHVPNASSPESALAWPEALKRTGLEDFLRQLKKHTLTEDTCSLSSTSQLVFIKSFQSQVPPESRTQREPPESDVGFEHVSFASHRYLDEFPDATGTTVPGTGPLFDSEECRWFRALHSVLSAAPASRGEPYRALLDEVAAKIFGEDRHHLPSLRGVAIANDRLARANFPAYGTASSSYPFYDPRQRPWWLITTGGGHQIVLDDSPCWTTRPYPDIGEAKKLVTTLACVLAEGDGQRKLSPHRWVLAIDFEWQPPSLGGPSPPTKLAPAQERIRHSLGLDKVSATTSGATGGSDRAGTPRIDEDRVPPSVWPLPPHNWQMATTAWLASSLAAIALSLLSARREQLLRTRRVALQYADTPQIKLDDVVSQSTTAQSRKLLSLTLPTNLLKSLASVSLSRESSQLVKRTFEAQRVLSLDPKTQPQLRARELWIVEKSQRVDFRFGCFERTPKQDLRALVELRHTARADPDVRILEHSPTDRLPDVAEIETAIFGARHQQLGRVSSPLQRYRLGLDIESNLRNQRVDLHDPIQRLDEIYKERNVDAVVQWSMLQTLVGANRDQPPTFLFAGSKVDRTILFNSEEERERAFEQNGHYIEALVRKYIKDGGMLYTFVLSSDLSALRAYTELSFSILDGQTVIVVNDLKEEQALLHGSDEITAHGYISAKPADVQFFQRLYDDLKGEPLVF